MVKKLKNNDPTVMAIIFGPVNSECSPTHESVKSFTRKSSLKKVSSPAKTARDAATNPLKS